MGLILLIIVLLLVIGALPTWPYSTGWGYYPSGGLGLILRDSDHSSASGQIVNSPPHLGTLRGCQMSSLNPAEKSGSFVRDIEEIRCRARQHIEDGGVTEAYRGDRATVIRVLNEALATELVCVLRYKRHYYMASGIHAQAVAEEFLKHAKEEQQHADKIAERMTQLDGEPDLNPDTLTRRSHSEYIPGESLLEMIREDLVAERIAIDSYKEIIRYLGDNDPASRRVMEEILAKEEEPAEDLKTLIQSLARDEEQWLRDRDAAH